MIFVLKHTDHITWFYSPYGSKSPDLPSNTYMLCFLNNGEWFDVLIISKMWPKWKKVYLAAGLHSVGIVRLYDIHTKIAYTLEMRRFICQLFINSVRCDHFDWYIIWEYAVVISNLKQAHKVCISSYYGLQSLIIDNSLV